VGYQDILESLVIQVLADGQAIQVFLVGRDIVAYLDGLGIQVFRAIVDQE
jgi:hypothetical protein